MFSAVEQRRRKRQYACGGTLQRLGPKRTVFTFETERLRCQSDVAMAVQELERLFSTVIESQITLALTLLNSGPTTNSDVQDTEAKRIAVLACNAAERFASRLPAPDTRLYWNRRVIDLRLALADVRQ